MVFPRALLRDGTIVILLFPAIFYGPDFFMAKRRDFFRVHRHVKKSRQPVETGWREFGGEVSGEKIKLLPCEESGKGEQVAVFAQVNPSFVVVDGLRDRGMQRLGVYGAAFLFGCLRKREAEAARMGMLASGAFHFPEDFFLCVFRYDLHFRRFPFVGV